MASKKIVKALIGAYWVQLAALYKMADLDLNAWNLLGAHARVFALLTLSLPSLT